MGSSPTGPTNARESRAYGIELGTPRQRSDRFEEACEVLTGLLSPRETTSELCPAPPAPAAGQGTSGAGRRDRAQQKRPWLGYSLGAAR